MSETERGGERCRVEEGRRRDCGGGCDGRDGDGRDCD